MQLSQEFSVGGVDPGDPGQVGEGEVNRRYVRVQPSGHLFEDPVYGRDPQEGDEHSPACRYHDNRQETCQGRHPPVPAVLSFGAVKG